MRTNQIETMMSSTIDTKKMTKEQLQARVAALKKVIMMMRAFVAHREASFVARRRGDFLVFHSSLMSI